MTQTLTHSLQQVVLSTENCDVLVLEDDDLIRNLVVDVCEQNHLCTHEAASIDDGRRLLRTSQCRVLITDNDLGPGETGFAFAKGLRQECPDLGVIYVTGRQCDPKELGLTGRDRALPKPFSVDHLVQAIQDLLQEPLEQPQQGIIE
jgi:two-component system, OmpR family, response regulator